jgi:hypothetical protein
MLMINLKCSLNGWLNCHDVSLFNGVVLGSFTETLRTNSSLMSGALTLSRVFEFLAYRKNC